MGNSINPECFVFSDGQNRNDSIIAMLPALLQQRGVDPSLIAMCSKRDNGWSDLLGLIVILAICGGNGFGGGGLFGGNRGGGFVPNMINNDANTQMLMQSIQRNGLDVQSLANMTNTSSDAIIGAINAVGKDLGYYGLNTQQGFNATNSAITQSSNALQTQLANCCCTLRDAITQQGYQSQLGQKDVQNAMQFGFNSIQVGQERGFSQLGYASQQQTCDIKESIGDNTRAVLAKLDAIEDSRKDREINALTAENASLRAKAERQAELTPLYDAIKDVQCKQPNTVTVPYQPFVTVPSCVAWNAGLNALNYGRYTNGTGVFG